MITDEILEYVRKSLADGVAESDIRAELLKSGWTEEEIGETFESLPQVTSPQSLAESQVAGSNDTSAVVSGGQVASAVSMDVEVQLPPSTEMLGAAWVKYVRNFILYVSVLSPLLIFQAVIPALSQFLFPGIVAGGIPSIQLIVPFVVIGLVGMFLSVLAPIALMYAIIHEGKVTLAVAYTHALKRLWSYVLVSWLYFGQIFATFMLLAIVVGTASVGFAVNLLEESQFPIFIGSAVISCAIALVYVYYIAFVYGFALWSLMSDDVRGARALLYSKHLVRGRVLATIIRTLLPAALFVAIGIVGFAVSYVTRGDVALYFAPPTTEQILFSALIKSIAVIVVLPLAALYVYELYVALKKTRNTTFEVKRGEKSGIIGTAIVGALLMFVVPAGLAALTASLMTARSSGQDASLAISLSMATVNLEMYAAEHDGRYPASFDEVGVGTSVRAGSTFHYRVSEDLRSYTLCIPLVSDSTQLKCKDSGGAPIRTSTAEAEDFSVVNSMQQLNTNLSPSASESQDIAQGENNVTASICLPSDFDYDQESIEADARKKELSSAEGGLRQYFDSIQYHDGSPKGEKKKYYPKTLDELRLFLNEHYSHYQTFTKYFADLTYTVSADRKDYTLCTPIRGENECIKAGVYFRYTPLRHLSYTRPDTCLENLSESLESAAGNFKIAYPNGWVSANMPSGAFGPDFNPLYLSAVKRPLSATDDGEPKLMIAIAQSPSTKLMEQIQKTIGVNISDPNAKGVVIGNVKAFPINDGNGGFEDSRRTSGYVFMKNDLLYLISFEAKAGYWSQNGTSIEKMFDSLVVM